MFHIVYARSLCRHSPMPEFFRDPNRCMKLLLVKKKVLLRLGHEVDSCNNQSCGVGSPLNPTR
jgi:hypothetical protein